MPRHKEPPWGFVCPYEHHCPYLQGLSTQGVFSEYQRSHIREHAHWLSREEMAEENSRLLQSLRKQEEEIDRLKAENKRLHQQQFKPNIKKQNETKASNPKTGQAEIKKKKKRGAPKGHPPWNRKKPEKIDQTVEVDAPCTCPNCSASTDLSRPETTSYVQEDIVLRPQIIVTEYIHTSAWCPNCEKQVVQTLDKEIPNAPIGPSAKATALFLRHDLKLSYRKIQLAMKTLYGFDFVPASTLGFEKRARKNADPVYADLIEKIRASNIVHADETHWRQDGINHQIWHAGTTDVAVFRIDKSRSSEAAKRLLGDKIDGLLVTDAYAGYNAIEVQARQSCLAHLIRKADELLKLLRSKKYPDHESISFCRKIAKLFTLACRKKIPAPKTEKQTLKPRFTRLLDSICSAPLETAKAETLRKRLIPGAREYDEVFAFIDFDGPPTNNHAERALRPLVIFRKISMGTRSPIGSENITIFASLVQTAKLQDAPVLPIMHALLTGSPAQAQAALFDNSG
jgi:transposase